MRGKPSKTVPRGANERTLLHELLRPYEGARLRAIARLLHRLSGVRPPEPIKFWQEVDFPTRVKAVEVWRQRIREAADATKDP